MTPDDSAQQPPATAPTSAAAAPSGGGRSMLRPRILPWAVLACTLLSTFAVAYYVWSKDKLRTDSAASKAAEAARDRLLNRMDSYIALLRGATGLISNRLIEGADRVPSHAGEFASYVERLELQDNYPGIQGVGFALRLEPDEREGFESAMRKSGDKDFK